MFPYIVLLFHVHLRQGKMLNCIKYIWLYLQLSLCNMMKMNSITSLAIPMDNLTNLVKLCVLEDLTSTAFYMTLYMGKLNKPIFVYNFTNVILR